MELCAARAEEFAGQQAGVAGAGVVVAEQPAAELAITGQAFAHRQWHSVYGGTVFGQAAPGWKTQLAAVLWIEPGQALMFVFKLVDGRFFMGAALEQHFRN